MKDRLTKTAYLRYLKCPQEFWLEYHQPLLVAEPITLEYEHLRQQGYAVQQLAKRLRRFVPSDEYTVDFERPFQNAEFYARSDISVTENATGLIDLYETKSAASVKAEHIDDIAFQAMVAEGNGFTVGRCFVITMNGDYIRAGEIDPEQLFVVSDVTEQVRELMRSTIERAQNARAYLETVPVPSLVDYCAENKLDCSFIKMHFPDLPEYTVFDIAFLKNEKRRDLLSQGIVSITDVPDDYPLSAKQRLQVSVAKLGEIQIDRDEIVKRVEGWEYPLQFLDYETFAYAIPQFDGLKPFQQMCFQYSLHTIDAPGAEPRHDFFLSRGDGEPGSLPTSQVCRRGSITNKKTTRPERPITPSTIQTSFKISLMVHECCFWQHQISFLECGALRQSNARGLLNQNLLRLAQQVGAGLRHFPVRL